MTKCCSCCGASNRNNASYCVSCGESFGCVGGSRRRCGTCGGKGRAMYVWGLDTCQICGGTGWV